MQCGRVSIPRPGFEPGTPSLEARHDVRFTTEAEERKARDLNPHDLAAARFSKPARRTVSGYLPAAASAGVEPTRPRFKASIPSEGLARTGRRGIVGPVLSS